MGKLGQAAERPWPKDWAWLGPPLATAIVFMVAAMTLEPVRKSLADLGRFGLELPPQPDGAAYLVLDMTARLTWGAIWVALVVGLVFGVLIVLTSVVRSLFRMSPSRRFRVFPLSIGLIAAIALGFYLSTRGQASFAPVFDTLGESMTNVEYCARLDNEAPSRDGEKFAQCLNRLPRYSHMPKGGPKHAFPGSAKDLTDRTGMSNQLAVFFIALLVLAVSMSLAELPDSPQPHCFRDQQRRLRFLLYMASALLVIGVVEIYTLFRWPAVHFPQRAVISAAQLESIAKSLAATAGVFFALLLGAIYLPAAAAVNRGLLALAKKAKPDSHADRKRWLEENGFAGPWEQVGQILAIVAPVLAGLASGPVGQMFGLLG